MLTLRRLHFSRAAICSTSVTVPAAISSSQWSAPAERSRWNVSLRLAVAPAWPAEPVGVAQPATRRRRAGTPLVLVASALLRLDAGGASLIDPMKRSITVGTKAIVDAHHEAVDVLPDVDRERCH